MKLWHIVGMFMSILVWAQEAVFTHINVILDCLGQILYLDRAPRTKETLPDFRECRVGYLTSTSIPQVDGLSTDTPILGRHSLVSEHRYTTT